MTTPLPPSRTAPFPVAQPPGASDKIFTILIIGAGVAGLAAAYALRESDSYKAGKVQLRVVERREEHDEQVGYPIHLSAAGRAALETLLTPSDAARLASARALSPVRHDGITVSSYAGKTVYRLIRDVGSDPIVERKALMDILRAGAGEVEYGVQLTGLEGVGKGKMVSVRLGRHPHPSCTSEEEQRAGDREGREREHGHIDTTRPDEEEMVVDLVIGADGMFSATRGMLQSSSFSSNGPTDAQSKYDSRSDPQTQTQTQTHSQAQAVDSSSSLERPRLERMEYTTVNLRTSSPEVLRWLKDPVGINTVYGDSFSATMIPLSSATYPASSSGVASEFRSSIELHSPRDDRDTITPALETSKRQDNTNNSTRLKSYIETSGDTTGADHTGRSSLLQCSIAHPKALSPTADPPSRQRVYVALTVPSKWLEPTYAQAMARCTCPPTIASRFLRDLEGCDGWSGRKGFELWSMNETFPGRTTTSKIGAVGGAGACAGRRVVLIGDAAHGMTPFCGAGASSALVDSVQLVRGLDLALKLTDDLKNIDLALDTFQTQSRSRNDKLIKQSKRVMWLAQGDGEVARILRRVIFWGMEMKERWSGQRKESEKELTQLHI